MKEVAIEESSGRIKVVLRAISTGKDFVVIITGGAGHIGAAAVGVSTGKLASSSVITVEGHRDDRVAKGAAEKISKKTGKTIAVIAGIHYDSMTREEIDVTLGLCDRLIERLLEAA